jgi:hypothetical protein
MKRAIPLIMLLAIAFSGFALPRYYTKAERKKMAADSLRIADSLRVIDSLRIADSIRIADSCMIARYRVADKIRTIEKAKKAEEKRKNEELKRTIALTEDTSAAITSSAVDNISARTVVIGSNSPYVKEIDSLQSKIDSLSDYLYDGDSRFKTMRTFAVSEKMRYMLYLLKNKMKDTSEIVSCCNKLFELYALKYDLLLAIKKSQDDNTKIFIQAHIEEHRRKMAELGDFLVSLTPEVPFHPELHLREELAGQ